ncbi:hypothetical protein BSZ39_02705 [Bowdeniella nasicola]|uniref:Helix-hairpin-helix DNA-binding motif class 1 domain-containing protein n=1 Tax=Bowdeniella nasicola TaxID=208480 RepID=A0A1Q5Q4T5_9ACTO|nr:ComEA family DNA-binding protein [Bowdeniella nasicola]OKL54712.1 hypothetical protein BSZ39_02705 [Bowdeniella nasicola]
MAGSSDRAIERRRIRVLMAPRTVLALIVGIVIAALAATAWHVMSGTGSVVKKDPAAPSPPPIVAEEPSGVPSPDATVVVYVTGQVQAPGVYTLPAGARVTDAIAAAGGMLPDADAAAQNLARHLADGEHVHVPTPGEPPPSDAQPGGAAKSSSGVNVNTASATELQEIPGIGPALAQRIVDHRETNGPFASIDALDDVSGIGPALLSRIRDSGATT